MLKRVSLLLLLLPVTCDVAHGAGQLTLQRA
jgi:hypothetical protein